MRCLSAGRKVQRSKHYPIGFRNPFASLRADNQRVFVGGNPVDGVYIIRRQCSVQGVVGFYRSGVVVGLEILMVRRLRSPKRLGLIFRRRHVQPLLEESGGLRISGGAGPRPQSPRCHRRRGCLEVFSYIRHRNGSAGNGRYNRISPVGGFLVTHQSSHVGRKPSFIGVHAGHR